MTAADIPLGLKLARQAGWNQMEADWRRFLAMQPDGCFVGEWDGAPVATTAAFIFGPVAWIAMVLVDIESRRKGIATTLLQHALDFLDAQGVQTVRLDATAAGQPVYEKLGFVPEYCLTRYMGTAAHRGAAPGTRDDKIAEHGTVAQLVVPRTSGPRVSRASGPRIEGGTPSTHAGGTPATRASQPRPSDDPWREVFAFDHRMTATSRAKMLARLFEESPDLTRVWHQEGQLQGYITGRRGANATLIGPCVATAEAGPVLLGGALCCCAGQPVFIDVPRDNAPAIALVENSGLTAQRHFMRMCRGARIEDHTEAIWASSGPEKG